MTMITDAPAEAPIDAPAAPADAAAAPVTPPADAPADQAKTPEQVAADEAAAAAGAPEKYEDFKAPEGAALDAGVMTKFADAARALNLPQDKAQQLVDQMAPVMAARQAEQVDALNNEWMAASKAYKEFGGAALAENLVHAKRAMDTLGTPELREILNGTKLGNNPEMVRFMVRAGKALGEDKIITGGNQATAKKTTNADRLYGPDAKK